MTILAFRIFYVFGGALAIWAVVLSFLGLSSARFPGKLGGQRIVIGISAILVALAIGSAVTTTKTEETHQPGITAPGKTHPK